jgi:ribosome-binding protein aMBF1 (putative translation factor)
MKLKEFRQRLEQDPEYVKAAEELRLQLHLADAVLKARLKKGWSQTQLAKAIGTKQANISRIEAGLANPTLSLLHKLLKTLDLEMKISDLVDVPKYDMLQSDYANKSIPVLNWPLRQVDSDIRYKAGASSKTDQGILK